MTPPAAEPTTPPPSTPKTDAEADAEAGVEVAAVEAALSCGQALEEVADRLVCQACRRPASTWRVLLDGEVVASRLCTGEVDVAPAFRVALRAALAEAFPIPLPDAAATTSASPSLVVQSEAGAAAPLAAAYWPRPEPCGDVLQAKSKDFLKVARSRIDPPAWSRMIDS